ncbi:hypothetical protein LV475_06400 [Guyparkeria hydrothermalis]|uniref:3-hydroxylacyl-ACP dehydratase n=1 Tax=Guyparkeria halophila TaxID=47960 RepID=A0A6I6D382_9GAMM|nr:MULTISPECIES: hypothetical protein [Guyparkeria]MCL7751224.1 hypothetical protein [Guyparkeria hydrothermalis]QGT78393.1 hypothetical protein GM160_05490 [Guyparkeria halophila]
MPTSSDFTHLDAHAIGERLPHQGAVCQLERVLSCGENTISCETRAHQRPDNPLRLNERLGVFAGVEMAGQAMALHLALTATGQPDEASAGVVGDGDLDSHQAREGMITRASDLNPRVGRFDDLPDPLRIDVTCEAQVGEMARYRFSITHRETVLLDGGLSVLLSGD